MIAGKGHEQGQEFAGGHKLPFDDVDRRQGGAAARAPRTRARAVRRADEGLGRRRMAAAAAGAELLREPAVARTTSGAPRVPAARASTRAPSPPGELFVGLRGERSDGGAHARAGAAAGAWGVLVAPEHAPRDGASRRRR